MLTWCTIPVPGGTTLNWLKRLLAPAQEAEPLPVALELELHVALERVRPAEHVGDHRVVDHQLGRDQRVDPARVAAEVPHRLAHGGKVDHRGHAGQVLHDHPGRAELDLGGGLGRRVPRCERRDVVGRDVHAVLGPQQVLQQDLEAEREVTGTRRPRPAGVSRSWSRRPAACRDCRSCWVSSWPPACCPSCPATVRAAACTRRPCITPLSHLPATAASPCGAALTPPPAPVRPRQYLDIKLSTSNLARIYLDVKLLAPVAPSPGVAISLIISFLFIGSSQWITQFQPLCDHKSNEKTPVGAEGGHVGVEGGLAVLRAAGSGVPGPAAAAVRALRR